MRRSRRIQQVLGAIGTTVTFAMIGCGGEQPTHPISAATAPAPTPLAKPVASPPADPALRELPPVTPVSRVLTVPEESAALEPSRTSGPGRQVFQALTEAFGQQQVQAYQTAEEALVKLGADAIPTLLDELAARDTTTRELASTMLLRILPETMLVDPNFPADRHTYVLQELEQALDDTSADVRVNVASSLSLFTPVSQRLVPVLRELLTSELTHQRLMAVIALGNLGPRAADAAPELQACLQDAEADVRAAAADALKHLEPAR